VSKIGCDSPCVSKSYACDCESDAAFHSDMCFLRAFSRRGGVERQPPQAASAGHVGQKREREMFPFGEVLQVRPGSVAEFLVSTLDTKCDLEDLFATGRIPRPPHYNMAFIAHVDVPAAPDPDDDGVPGVDKHTHSRLVGCRMSVGIASS
jgi:hypothetical protein